MDKEFKELQQENDKLRNQINDILRTEFDKLETRPIMVLINKLINNEIEQERYCNK